MGTHLGAEPFDEAAHCSTVKYPCGIDFRYANVWLFTSERHDTRLF